MRTDIRNFIFILAIVIVVFPKPASSQDRGFIYGKVYTLNGDVYEGQIRWGKEEAFWFDFFNATKQENSYLKYLDRDELEELEDRSNDWGGRIFRRIFDVESNRDFNHVFICQFGDIKTIWAKRRNRVQIEFRNGEILRFDDGSNDVGARINVLDDELGSVSVKWDRLEKVEFMKTPKKLDVKYGDPIYGTVTTRRGEITGFIQWDHDERINTDKLDGDTRDEDLSIQFKNIKSIEKAGRGVDIVTNRGREISLWGSNDVDKDNRGIIINTPGYGRVDVPWKEFEKVEFKKAPKNAMPSYDDFDDPKQLSGTVTTVNGKSYSGTIIYDLDEFMSYEILQGENDDIEYLIPFGSIKRITPKNYRYSTVELTNGEKVIIGESQDVSDRNYGILVFFGEKNPKYIPWKDIEEIRFK